jgi:uncharacterized protein (TIGR04551 family)
MSRALLAALLMASAAASAQTPPAPGGTTDSKPAAPAGQGGQGTGKAKAESAPKADAAKPESDEVRREVEARLEAIKKEVREEVRAQLATQSVAQGWQEEWVEEKRKLELFTVDGYLRVRPDLFNKFDLNREPDPGGNLLFPRSPVSDRERTVAGANMRFRFEPTLNVSEEVRIRMQVDALDNLVLGTTPDYAFSRSQRNEFSIFSETQVPPRSGINALKDSIALKRVYGEVSTPVGILRFGRMGSQWGLGMLHNDGDCLDCDFGDTVDRLQFVTSPFSGWYITPMLDFNTEGPISGRGDQGQPFDLSNYDDTHSYVIAIARRDTDQQARAKLESGQFVLNYGVHFAYRTQRNDPVDFFTGAFSGEGGDTASYGYVGRNASLFIPDLWAKFERKSLRVELEAAAIFGGITNRALSAAGDALGANQSLKVLQLGGVLQGEYRLMDGKLRIGAEVGFASGDPAPGLGNYPRRRGSRPDGFTAPGDFDGPQYACPTDCGEDDTISNFRFNRDYRIDLILWREILGGATDALYAKPTVSYEILDGLKVHGSAVYSRTIFATSSPSGTSNDLGLELDAGAQYETDDGFMAGVQYGILFPLSGLAATGPSARTLESAQTLRGWIGIKY